MKNTDNYIERKASVITGKENLEQLYSFKDFPVFMGCVDTLQSEDVVADMEWFIDSDTGVIQLKKLIPLDILYLNQHNDGIGQVWKDHYKAFSKFLMKYNPKNVLEIGGAHDYIANNCFSIGPELNWTIVEPNPLDIKNKKIKVIKGWFNNKFSVDEPIDTVIHSHVLEHIYNPSEFFEHISKFLKKGERHIFTVPNLEEMLKKNYTNCLNFEHTVFLTEDLIDYLLEKYGFRIIEKKYYGSPHSIFYATEKVEVPKDLPLPKNKYVEYKKIFLDFVDYHKQIVGELNNKIKESNEPVYLFGAHVFSTYLISFGLKTNKIVSLLDNSSIKQGKRLYGTDLMVESPKVLANKGPVNVILKAGIYNNEIKKDILENINSEVIFW